MKQFLFAALLICAFTAVLSVQSCYNDSEEDLYGAITNTTCDTAKVSFSATVLSTMTSSCATSGCHKGASAASGINLETYTPIKTYVTSAKAVFLGSMRHSSSFSAMPKGAAKLPDCTVNKIEAWINAGMPNN